MKTSLLFTLLDIKVQFNRLFLLFVILFIIFGILKILWPWPFKSIKKVEEENTKDNEEIGKKIELFAEEIKYSSLENLFSILCAKIISLILRVIVFSLLKIAFLTNC